MQVSRVAAGHPNGLALEVFGDNGAAKWEQERSGSSSSCSTRGPLVRAGYRRVIIGPGSPVFRRRPADGRPGRGRWPERWLRLPGARFPEEGRVGIDEADSLPRNAVVSTRAYTTWRSLAAVAESAANGRRHSEGSATAS